MVNASECLWSEEQVKALITFLIAEKKRHERDIHNIERTIARLKREYKLTDADIAKCEELAWLYVEF
ncbi:MAG: hypothetical protein OBKJMPBA_00017 [Methanophagales virus PBV304]|uniref:Uncharacterized protein n=1 Tax=Methanophagales virus PBV304 TaxID=3071309 RepID=A0AA46YIU3_9VIRU|nr:MAG: hypothetical protein QIT47_gp17 [Methanophagales virus PBV304]UYL65049.1 MAG: hypothetical protein OBKJMPBA_00017 [Methanophagales virus PBV304]